MRKQGRRAHKAVSVYERLQRQRQAQKKEQAVKKAAQIETLPESDIEIDLSDRENSRSVPKTATKQEKPPSRKARPKATREKGHLQAVRDEVDLSDSFQDIQISFSEDDSEDCLQVKPRKSPKKEENSNPSAGHDEQPRTAVRKISPQKKKKSPQKKKKSPGKEPKSPQPETAAKPPEIQIVVPPIQPAEIKAGLPRAVAVLRERLLNVRGGDAHPMALRPALPELQGQLRVLLKTTIDVQGENSSMLIVGPRGVGKTLVVERTAMELAQEYNTEESNPRIGFVRLTGLLHTEERAAFKEVARQLCRSFKCSFSKTASLEDNLGFLRDMLKELQRAHKVVIFILEEFDMFARKPKQTLLYNLLDAMQAADMQAAVIGISSRSDVTEMLEKRVKSRFSYRRYLVLDTCSTEVGERENGATSILEAMLSLPEGLKGLEEGFLVNFNASVRKSLHSEAVTAVLQRLCFKGIACPRELANIAIHALSQASFAQTLLQSSQLVSACRAADTDQDAQVESVKNLSVLELFLLVAFARLRRKGRETPNFEMAFDEYSSLRRDGSYRGVDDSAPKPSAFRAFERLISAALIAYSDARATTKSGLREFFPACLLLTQQELEAGLRLNPACPSALLEWLKKEVLTSYAADDSTAV